MIRENKKSFSVILNGQVTRFTWTESRRVRIVVDPGGMHRAIPRIRWVVDMISGHHASRSRTYIGIHQTEAEAKATAERCAREFEREEKP